jgi:hypothetical protein
MQVCSIKGLSLFQRGDNHKNVKMGWGHMKISRTIGPILTRLDTNIPWVMGIQISSKKGDSPFPRGGNCERLEIHSH